MVSVRPLVAVLTLLVVQAHSLKLANRMYKAFKTDIKHFPYVVALYWDDHDVVGTGAIISSKFVITAAHIWDAKIKPLTTLTTKNTFIWYGTTIIDDHMGEVAEIKTVHIHPKYDNGIGKAYDVSLLEVVSELNLRPGLSLAKELVEDDVINVPGSVCALAGYGENFDYPPSDDEPHVLDYMTLPILTRATCRKRLGGIPSKMMCAGAVNTASGPCTGDDGAPFVCAGKLYAILSKGLKCTKKIETNINTFVLINTVRDFIRTTTGIQ